MRQKGVTDHFGPSGERAVRRASYLRIRPHRRRSSVFLDVSRTLRGYPLVRALLAELGKAETRAFVCRLRWHDRHRTYGAVLPRRIHPAALIQGGARAHAGRLVVSAKRAATLRDGGER